MELCTYITLVICCNVGRPWDMNTEVENYMKTCGNIIMLLKAGSWPAIRTVGGLGDNNAVKNAQ